MIKGESYFEKARALNSLLYEKNLDAGEKRLLYQEYILNLRKSAYAGNKEAQYEYGLTFEEINYWGNNKFSSAKKCFDWYLKAANQDHPEACNNLAILFESGEGCEKNTNKAIFYYKKAIESGSLNAKRNLKILNRQLNKGN
jgi:TPR repeat protein